MNLVTFVRVAAVGLSLVAAPAALAGTCDAYVAKAATARGEALVSTYKSLAKCDVNLARTTFDRFAVSAGDVETLVPLTLAALDVEAFEGVWGFITKVPAEHRTTVAQEVGAACESHPSVVSFFRTTYAGMKGPEFSSWKPALGKCASPAMASWLDEVVAQPPTSTYNERYNAVLTALVDQRHAGALPVLEQAAITAGKQGGPFGAVLDAIQRTADGHGSTADLEQTLVRIAAAVPPESARAVADRLLNAGNEPLAASLLPAIYPDRVQSDGTMLWAVAAVEACDGDAVIHWATVREQPKRLSVLDAATVPLRTTKAKLKCPPDTAWTIRAAEEPVASESDAAAWVDTLVTELDGQGLKAKLKQETISVPAP